MQVRTTLALAPLCAAVLAGHAQAAAWTYADRASFSAALSSSTTITFEGLADPMDGYTLYGETLVVGGVTFSESSPLYPAPGAPTGNLFVYDEGYAAGFYETNGLTSDFLNQNTGNGAPVVLSFASPVYALALDLGSLYASGETAFEVNVTLSSGETFSTSVPVVGFSTAALSFFGFAADVGVTSVSFYDPNQNLVLDNVTYSLDPVSLSTAVPAPLAAPLLFSGLAGLALLRRRR